MTKIITLDETRFDDNEIDEAAIERHVPPFLAYLNQWKGYNRAKKVGQKPKIPEFPFDTIRVYKIDGAYLPIDDNVTAILLVARKAQINRVRVIVEELVMNLDGISLDEPPIHANRFFTDFKTALKRLQATDPQRVEFFKPLLQAMLNQGFTDKFCRTEFIAWTRKEFDRYVPGK